MRVQPGWHAERVEVPGRVGAAPRAVRRARAVAAWLPRLAGSGGGGLVRLQGRIPGLRLGSQPMREVLEHRRVVLDALAERRVVQRVGEAAVELGEPGPGDITILSKALSWYK